MSSNRPFPAWAIVPVVFGLPKTANPTRHAVPTWQPASWPPRRHAASAMIHAAFIPRPPAATRWKMEQSIDPRTFRINGFGLMATLVSTTPDDPVKQFSVFAENRLGRLYDLTAVLKEHNVHIMGITVLDTTDSAIVRFIVDDPEKARELMINNDFPYVECKVLVVEIADESQFNGVLAALFEAEINIHYIYGLIQRPNGRSALAMKPEDDDVAAQALSQRGYRVLTQRDIAR